MLIDFLLVEFALSRQEPERFGFEFCGRFQSEWVLAQNGNPSGKAVPQHGKQDTNDLFHVSEIVQIAINRGGSAAKSQKLPVCPGCHYAVKRVYGMSGPVIEYLRGDKFGKTLRDAAVDVLFFRLHNRDDRGLYLSGQWGKTEQKIAAAG